ncbi:MAG TPA: FadR/GntR family transcriptional regulator [Hyphomicrobiaceae bacterium]|jgi:DNA-binding FadR family transcriptional regulator|nr:FadR/GntR family transcriptional regulator [Hyphomicrobiaceae bacterium]
MPIQAVSVQRLYQQIAARIAELIEVGEFAFGARLPPERDLALQFGVSRPTVREALIALEISGLVEVRTGSGAYVIHRKSDARSIGKPVHLADAGPSTFDLIAARRVVEPAVAAQAAQLSTPQEVAVIAHALEQFERHWNGTHWEKLEADRDFHLALAAASHNSVLLKIVEGLWADMFGPIFAVLSERTQLTNRQEMTFQDHRVILLCVERHDAVGASAAMNNHLLHVQMTLESGTARLGRDPGRIKSAAARATSVNKPATESVPRTKGKL